jgi:hypothetical protein
LAVAPWHSDKCIADERIAPAPAACNSTAFGLFLERRGKLGGARPALEFSIAHCATKWRNR